MLTKQSKRKMKQRIMSDMLHQIPCFTKQDIQKYSLNNWSSENDSYNDYYVSKYLSNGGCPEKVCTGKRKKFYGKKLPKSKR